MKVTLPSSLLGSYYYNIQKKNLFVYDSKSKDFYKTANSVCGFVYIYKLGTKNY